MNKTCVEDAMEPEHMAVIKGIDQFLKFEKGEEDKVRDFQFEDENESDKEIEEDMIEEKAMERLEILIKRMTALINKLQNKSKSHKANKDEPKKEDETLVIIGDNSISYMSSLQDE